MNSFMMDIKNNSNDLHDVAEKTGFLKRLLEGKASKESYAEYLFNLYEIYKAIEINLEKNDKNEVVKNFTTKEVYRSEAIYKDLTFLLGEGLHTIRPLPSTKAYVARINELGEISPELLVAHAYTRYLADLFGGRTIYKMIKDFYKIEDEGLNYYQYEALEEGEGMKGFIMDYHNKLNTIELNDQMKEKFINEVANSYIYNISISNELDFVKYNN
ncbi:heme oxygenase (biliverdin-producing) [Clostridium sp. B9]|uniref:biliverdin-producing heme oxygenase n=1 Tax=Clostridium sp. B9 TaxID=3423224 RepID=UPI003D2EAAE7